MDFEERIRQELTKESTRSYWLGVVVGLVLGFGSTYFFGAHICEKTIVIPTMEAVKV